MTEEFTEWPVKEDFEGHATGQAYAHVPGKNKAKGSDGYVTDRIACASSKSLEIRDGTEGWAPMVKVDVSTTRARNLYCPMLGADLPEDGRTYRTVNWGFVPQSKTVHRSPIMYYVQTRDVGDGVIEMTYVVHNFSARDDIVFRWQNAPWGGTRMSSLPFSYLSSPEGDLRDREWMKENAGAIGVRKTGGWNLCSAGESPDSPSLALVFGRDKHLESEKAKGEQGLPQLQVNESIYRHMIGQGMPENWRTIPENAWRNYEVAVVIPQFRLTPGRTIWYRSYLVVNRRDRAIELAKSLVNEVDYGLLTFDPATTPMVPVYVEAGEVAPGRLGLRAGAGAEDGAALPDATKPTFHLFAHPVPGTMPLFLIENATTGQEVITTDPYIFVPQEKLDLGISPDDPKLDYFSNTVGYSMDKNESHWKRHLGYGYVEKPAAGAFVPLSQVLDSSLFPPATIHHLDLQVKR